MTEISPKRRSGRGLKWALGISLALNLIIVGFVGGAAWRFAGPEGAERKMRVEAISSGMVFVHALPREARREMRRAARRDGKGLPDRAARRAMYGDVLRVLRAETFDAAAVEAVFAQQAATAQGVLSRAQAGWVEVVSDMTVAERRAVADRLEEGLRRGAKRGPKQGQGKP